MKMKKTCKQKIAVFLVLFLSLFMTVPSNVVKAATEENDQKVESPYPSVSPVPSESPFPSSSPSPVPSPIGSSTPSPTRQPIASPPTYLNADFTSQVKDDICLTWTIRTYEVPITANDLVFRYYYEKEGYYDQKLKASTIQCMVGSEVGDTFKNQGVQCRFEDKYVEVICTIDEAIWQNDTYTISVVIGQSLGIAYENVRELGYEVYYYGKRIPVRPLGLIYQPDFYEEMMKESIPEPSAGQLDVQIRKSVSSDCVIFRYDITNSVEYDLNELNISYRYNKAGRVEDDFECLYAYVMLDESPFFYDLTPNVEITKIPWSNQIQVEHSFKEKLRIPAGATIQLMCMLNQEKWLNFQNLEDYGYMIFYDGKFIGGRTECIS